MTKTNRSTSNETGRRVMASAARRAIAWVIASLAIVTSVAASEAAAQSQARAAGRTAAASTTTSTAPTTPSASGVVDVNSATEAELVLLPGIGPSKARAILATRQRMGRFRRVEDLLRVRGIGRATLRRIRTMVTLQGGTTMTSRPSTPRRSAAPDEEVSAE